MMGKLRMCGTSCGLLFLGMAMTSSAQTLSTLHSFDGRDGSNPDAPLVQATDGNLYGVTSLGGTSTGGGSCTSGCGTVFKMAPSGTLNTLDSFDLTDGAIPSAALVQAANGSFYGTTAFGGTSSACSDLGHCGAAFTNTPTGTLTRLYSFCSESGCTDGFTPTGALILEQDGNFYGTTAYGGANGLYDGTVFRMSASGKLTTLYSFCSQSGCMDGASPYGTLIQAADGNLYGTTGFGGANGGECDGFGCGTVFKITPNGVLTRLYSFCSQSGCADGAEPYGQLVQATDGNLYGTTYYGGVSDVGTVFKITPSGTLTTLYSFCSQSECADGEYPKAGLVQATDGNLYGTTDGTVGTIYPYGQISGTLFKITPEGTLTTLYSFCSQPNCADGESPRSAVVQDTDGNLYGTTYYGGASSACTDGCGTAFSLSVGLRPFVETQPTTSKVGAAVKILGTNLAGASSVTFNGTPAAFIVESASYIKTTVPAGATTGTVQVVTLGGTLSSNLPFRVAP
jgi:uncharacterized repeat protein (TIGR03803 family)